MPRKTQRDRMVLISVHITKDVLTLVDNLVQSGLFPNRSEAIRAGVLMLLQSLCVQERKKQEERELEAKVLKGR